jgi:hypothetical protein
MEEEFQALTVLTLLLGHVAQASRAISIPKERFDFDAQTEADCKFNFRFNKQEIPRLASILLLPDPVVTVGRYSASFVEATCILLNRLAWPHRLGTLTATFGRSREALSCIANTVMHHIYDQFAHLLKWDHKRLDVVWMRKCGTALHSCGAPLETCIGFIDGTVRGICRPGKKVQKVAYNGHKVSTYGFGLSHLLI